MDLDSTKENVFYHIQNYLDYKIYNPNLAKDIRYLVCTTGLLNMAYSKFPEIVSAIFVDYLDELPNIIELVIKKTKEKVSTNNKIKSYENCILVIEKILLHKASNYNEKTKIDELRNELNDLITVCLSELKSLKTVSIIENSETKPALKVVALYCFYTNQEISNQNCDQIVKMFGHNSGKSLYHDYLNIISKTDRLASGETKVKHNNKLKLFEKVINMLKQNNCDYTKAQIDYNILKDKAKNFNQF